jgi:hypothetical protein
MAYFLRQKVWLLNLDAGKLYHVLDALAILEAATLECKQRDIYTSEVREALDFLQSHVRLEWLIPQFRYHAQLNKKSR